MPVFACTRCNAAENTALCGYWERRYAQQRAVFKDPAALTSPPLCSACDPALRKWHGLFPKESAAGLLSSSHPGPGVRTGLALSPRSLEVVPHALQVIA